MRGKSNLHRLFYTLAVLCIVIGVVVIGLDRIAYDSMLNSAPFRVFMLVRAIEFGIPAILLWLIGLLYQKKHKK